MFCPCRVLGVLLSSIISIVIIVVSFFFIIIIRFSGVAVDIVPVTLVNYPHCTPITPSRRTKVWKDSAPVPDLTLPRPEYGTEKNMKCKDLDLQTSLLSTTQDTPIHLSHS